MYRKSAICALFFAFLLMGCDSMTEEQQIQTESGLIPGIHLGMTTEEVFAVVGTAYDDILTEDSYKHTVEYDYILDDAEIAGISVPGYAFYEFDADDEILVCYGYHIGHNGDFESPEYPLSEEELADIYENYLEKLTEWYGAPGEPEIQTEIPNLLAESTWETDEGNLWLMYGVNLWAWETFEGFEQPYEQGINEVLVSCSAK